MLIAKISFGVPDCTYHMMTNYRLIYLSNRLRRFLHHMCRVQCPRRQLMCLFLDYRLTSRLVRMLLEILPRIRFIKSSQSWPGAPNRIYQDTIQVLRQLLFDEDEHFQEIALDHRAVACLVEPISCQEPLDIQMSALILLRDLTVPASNVSLCTDGEDNV